MDDNYNNLVAYLHRLDVKFVESTNEKMLRFVCEVDNCDVSILIHFQDDNRIYFSSLIDLLIDDEHLTETLLLVNAFNDMLNDGGIILRKDRRIDYRISIPVLGNILSDSLWEAMLLRLFRIPNDVYPLFRDIVENNGRGLELFQSFFKEKEKEQNADVNQIILEVESTNASQVILDVENSEEVGFVTLSDIIKSRVNIQMDLDIESILKKN